MIFFCDLTNCKHLGFPSLNQLNLTRFLLSRLCNKFYFKVRLCGSVVVQPQTATKKTWHCSLTALPQGWGGGAQKWKTHGLG